MQVPAVCRVPSFLPVHSAGFAAGQPALVIKGSPFLVHKKDQLETEFRKYRRKGPPPETIDLDPQRYHLEIATER